MQEVIKPIETHFRGYRFRSRLEARWAVFFTALGVDFEYEPEGFDLGNGMYYLPDFRVKCWGTRGDIRNKPFDLYIEVKGKMTKEDADKIIRFAKANNPVLIVGNIPSECCACDSYDVRAYEPMDGINIYPFNYELIDGDYFAAYPAAYKGKFFLWGDDSNYIWNTVEVEQAYELARQARFEHREKPIIRRYNNGNI